MTGKIFNFFPFHELVQFLASDSLLFLRMDQILYLGLSSFLSCEKVFILKIFKLRNLNCVLLTVIANYNYS